MVYDRYSNLNKKKKNIARFARCKGKHIAQVRARELAQQQAWGNPYDDEGQNQRVGHRTTGICRLFGLR